MALDRESYMNLLKEIADTGGPTDNMMELLQKLRDDFDDREGELRARGEQADSENPGTEATEEHIREESIEDNKEDGGLRRDPMEGYVPQADYDDLKRRYIERFFGGRDYDEDPETQEAPPEEKDKGIDSLFKKED